MRTAIPCLLRRGSKSVITLPAANPARPRSKPEKKHDPKAPRRVISATSPQSYQIHARSFQSQEQPRKPTIGPSTARADISNGNRSNETGSDGERGGNARSRSEAGGQRTRNRAKEAKCTFESLLEDDVGGGDRRDGAESEQQQQALRVARPLDRHRSLA